MRFQHRAHKCTDRPGHTYTHPQCTRIIAYTAHTHMLCQHTYSKQCSTQICCATAAVIPCLPQNRELENLRDAVIHDAAAAAASRANKIKKKRAWAWLQHTNKYTDPHTPSPHTSIAHTAHTRICSVKTRISAMSAHA